MSKSSESPQPRARDDTTNLTGGQVFLMAGWGVLLWFAAALLIRIAPPLLFARGVWTSLLFAAALPVAWLTIWLTRRLFSVSSRQIVPAAVLVSASAMLCDGPALTWTPLYGPEKRDLVPAAALLLWGVGWILIGALAEAWRNRD